MMTTTHVSAEDYDPEHARDMMRETMGPQAVDQAIRQAISMCWMMLPAESKNVESVEREIRRVVDRALNNLKEDAAAFGIATTQRPSGTARKPKKGRGA